MKRLPINRGAAALEALVVLVLAAGCQPATSPRVRLWERAAATPVSTHALACDLDVTLDPPEHAIRGSARWTLEMTDSTMAAQAYGIELRVHEALDITAASGAVVAPGGLRGPVLEDGRKHYIVMLADAPPVFDIEVTFDGRLLQDVAGGEKAGEIHNFDVNAHVGPAGVYLADGADWYPRVQRATGAAPIAPRYDLRIPRVPGFELVAGCPRAADDPHNWRWASSGGFDGLTVAGGPHVLRSRRVGDVVIETRLLESDADFSDGLLDAVEHYLGIYEPLLGPYPYAHFAIVENFFSSGFACPTFTLLGPEVIRMGERGLRPGYLDHELVHNWWGNGVFVDPRGGNWCEALTSYCTNYYRHVAEGRHDDARRHRRNILNGLSALPADRDRPLSAFGREDGVSRTIGYHKGEMVFYQLGRTIGEDALFAALRSLRTASLGRFVDWIGLQTAFEDACDCDLGAFFEAWVHGSGLPDIGLIDARYDSGDACVEVRLRGDARFGELQVPLRLVYAEGDTADTVVALQHAEQAARLSVARAVLEVQLDPDYVVPRRLPAGSLMPVLAMVRRGPRTVVLPAAEVADGYRDVAEHYAEGQDGRVITADELTAADLDGGHVLLLGDAVRHPAAAALLAASGLPLSWDDGGFVLEDTRYALPGDAVVATTHHPHRDNGVLAVYTGNAPAALHNAHLLGFYANSLVVFRDGMPLARRDFEGVERVAVTRD